MQETLQRYRTLIETELEEALMGSSPLLTAAKYSLFSGGKRLRPLLTLFTCEGLKGDIKKAIPFALAIELIHTYSLVHDDLPAMDNDDYRRGFPTLHKVVSEGKAILTGDFFLTYAFELLTRAPLPAERRIEVIRLIAQKSGSFGMIGGQWLDISQQFSLKEELEELHKMKTGALIEAAILAGAHAAEADPVTLDKLSHFAQKIGLAFQIIDDVLDVTHPEGKHGSSQGSDSQNNKLTYASLMGVDAAKGEAALLFNKAMEILDSLKYDFEYLRELAKLLVFRVC